MSFFAREPFADTERLIRAANMAYDLDRRCQGMSAREIVALACRTYGDRLTLVSSFGTEAAVLLHLVAQIDRDLPVTFVDTQRLFGETLRYRDDLVSRLGLTSVHVARPDPVRLREVDADMLQFQRDSGLCCYVRKVEPLQRALRPYDAWISGRKRFQATTRTHLPIVQAADGRVKFNPLADWSKADIDAYFTACDLPRHPLEAEGYLSLGCMPCTDRVAPGEDARAGRWRNSQKTECGIHTD